MRSPLKRSPGCCPPRAHRGSRTCLLFYPIGQAGPELTAPPPLGLCQRHPSALGAPGSITAARSFLNIRGDALCEADLTGTFFSRWPKDLDAACCRVIDSARGVAEKVARGGPPGGRGISPSSILLPPSSFGAGGFWLARWFLQFGRPHRHGPLPGCRIGEALYPVVTSVMAFLLRTELVDALSVAFSSCRG